MVSRPEKQFVARSGQSNARHRSFTAHCGQIQEITPKGVRIWGRYGNGENTEYFLINFPYHFGEGESIDPTKIYAALYDGTFSYVGMAVFDVGNVSLRFDTGGQRRRTSEPKTSRTTTARGIAWRIGCRWHLCNRLSRDQERRQGQRNASGRGSRCRNGTLNHFAVHHLERLPFNSGPCSVKARRCSR
jgi:hypothetical protein